MTIYYFDVHHNDVESIDTFGTDCESLHSASDQAQTLVIDLASEDREDRNNKDIVCVVRCAERIVRFKTLLSLRSEWEEPSDHEMEQFPETAYRFVP